MLKALLLVPVVLFVVVAIYDLLLVREMEPDRSCGSASEEATLQAQPGGAIASRTPLDRRESYRDEDKMAA